MAALLTTLTREKKPSSTTLEHLPVEPVDCTRLPSPDTIISPLKRLASDEVGAGLGAERINMPSIGGLRWGFAHYQAERHCSLRKPLREQGKE